MKKELKKAVRYVVYMCQYMGERIRGLDFSMPTAGELAKSRVEYYGYCKTSEKHVKKILKSVPVNPAESGFLDVGCGKGLALKAAKEFGYSKVAGIDFDQNLLDIAEKNMKVLGIEGVSCIYANALEFEHYGDYNVFYFFNPFDDTVLTPVVQRILDSVVENPRKIYILYHHPKYSGVMDRAGFEKIGTLYDSLRDYDTYVYTQK